MNYCLSSLVEVGVEGQNILTLQQNIVPCTWLAYNRELVNFILNLFFFFFLRKTGPELTSVPILYFIWGTPATAWPDKWCARPHPGSESGKPTPPNRNTKLTSAPPGQPCEFYFNARKILGVFKKIIRHCVENIQTSHSLKCYTSNLGMLYNRT